MINQILLNGIDVNELLEKIGHLIDTKLHEVLPAEKKDNQSKFISRQQVATLLKISLPTLNEWSKLGWLTSYKMGNRVLYKSKEVEQALCKAIAYKHKKGGNHGA